MLATPYRELVRTVFDELLDIGPRPHGSSQNNRAADYLEAQLKALGLTVERVPFVASQPRLNDDAVLTVIDGDQETVVCKAFLETAADGPVEGTLRFHGLTYIWGIHEWKVWRIGEPQAVGYVAARAEGPRVTQHLPEGSAAVPHAIVGPEMVETLDRLAQRGATVRLQMERPDNPVGGVSLLAYREGTSPFTNTDGRPLILGHYDTVPNSPGAFDNAGGAAAVVACAKAVADGEIDATILVTGGEEVGLAGSRAYVEELKRAGTLDAMTIAINLDGAGRGSQFEIWYGPESIQETVSVPLTESIADREGYTLFYRHPAPPMSDHQSFREVGLPAIHLSVNDLEVLHTPDDVWDADKLSNAELMAESAIAVTTYLARTNASLPNNAADAQPTIWAGGATILSDGN